MLPDPTRDARRRSARERERFERSRLVLERLAVEGTADPDELAAYDTAMDPDVRAEETAQRSREGQYWRRLRRRAYSREVQQRPRTAAASRDHHQRV
jgi:hypothetical protein